MPRREYSPALLAKLGAMQADIDAGLQTRQVAERAGVHKGTVSWLRADGLLSPSLMVVKRGPKIGRAPGIPRWVPRDLRPDYRDLAWQWGEEKAASEVRAMKAEAMRAEV